jgi:hypothetical protein
MAVCCIDYTPALKLVLCFKPLCMPCRHTARTAYGCCSGRELFRSVTGPSHTLTAELQTLNFAEFWIHTEICFCQIFWEFFAQTLIFHALFVRMFLGASPRLRKVTTIFVVSVRPSAFYSSAPTGRNWMKFDIWWFFENLSRSMKFR